MFWVIAPKQMKIGRCGSRHWNRRKTFFPMPQTSSSYHFLFRSYNLKQSQLPDKNEVFIGQLCQFWVIAPKRMKIGRCGLRNWNHRKTFFPMPQTSSFYLFLFRSYKLKHSQLPDKNEVFIGQLCLFWVITPKRMKIGRCGLWHENKRKILFPMPQTPSSYLFSFRSYNLKQAQLLNKNEVFIEQLSLMGHSS